MENKKTALNEKEVEGQIHEETQQENEQIVPVETFEEGEIVDGTPKKKFGAKEAAIGFVGGAAAAVGAMNLSDDISALLNADDEVVDVEPEPDPNVAAEPTAQTEPIAEPVVDVEPTTETGEVAVTPEEITPVAIDLNNDGTADALVVDQNNDGNVEAMGLDENHDGKVDTVFEDTDGDGDMDTVEVDTDFDGDFDNQQAIAETDQVTVELDVPQETHEDEAVVVDTDPNQVEEPVNAEPVADVDIPEEEFDTDADMSEWA